MIGYRFMGKAHSNAWRQAGRFFPLPAEIVLHEAVQKVGQAPTVLADFVSAASVLVEPVTTFFDEILVMDAGRVTQRGDHARLAAEPGWYRDAWLGRRLAEEAYTSLVAPGNAACHLPDGVGPPTS